MVEWDSIMLKSIITQYLSFVEFFPQQNIYTKYIDIYFEEVPLQIEPRNYWQDRLYMRSLINFNTVVNWVYAYPIDQDYLYLTLEKDPYYKIKISNFYNSIYEKLPLLKNTIDSVGERTKTVLTNNLYLYYMSSNIDYQTMGLKLCYYYYSPAISWRGVHPLWGIGWIDLFYQAWSFSFNEAFIYKHYYDFFQYFSMHGIWKQLYISQFSSHWEEIVEPLSSVNYPELEPRLRAGYFSNESRPGWLIEQHRMRLMNRELIKFKNN